MVHLQCKALDHAALDPGQRKSVTLLRNFAAADADDTRPITIEFDFFAAPRLLTGSDREHEVVAVLDSDGEFARTVPYATQLPRPVVGANGLVAVPWHPLWERNGGPQVSRRFRKLAERPMVGHDWATWMAVRSVAAVLQAQPGASVAQQARLLRSGQVTVDGAKGPALSFRAWDGQLRQPLFLSHVDGVAGTAPLDGVLHPTEVLDTLGVDEPETTCKQRP